MYCDVNNVYILNELVNKELYCDVSNVYYIQ